MSADLMICMGCRLHIANRRGLCDWCHRRIRRAVAEGKAAWAELERQGLVLPAEAGDYDTAEEAELPGDLAGWFVAFAVGLVFACAGLFLWALARGPFWLLGVLVFMAGISVMLVVLAQAVARCHGRAPPQGRE
jgi:hypothetical protein